MTTAIRIGVTWTRALISWLTYWVDRIEPPPAATLSPLEQHAERLVHEAEAWRETGVARAHRALAVLRTRFPGIPDRVLRYAIERRLFEALPAADRAAWLRQSPVEE